MPIWVLIALALAVLAGGGIAVAKTTIKSVSLDDVLPLVLQTARKYDIPPALILAIMKKESGMDDYYFNANAFNLEKDWWALNVKTKQCAICLKSRWKDDPTKWGSMGLMQIHFPTALRFDFKRVDANPEILFDPAYNIDRGGRLLAELYTKYNGSIRDIASAYNSGKSYKYAPYTTRFVYVPAVEDNYNFYKKL